MKKSDIEETIVIGESTRLLIFFNQLFQYLLKQQPFSENLAAAIIDNLKMTQDARVTQRASLEDMDR